MCLIVYEMSVESAGVCLIVYEMSVESAGASYMPDFKGTVCKICQVGA